MKELKFYLCKDCNKIVEVLDSSECSAKCFGDSMEEITANTTEAAHEKHIPVISSDGGKVTITVGSVEHPMQDAHYIEWILIETDKGIQKKMLQPGEKPVADFVLVDENLVAAYAYCNLHGLWKAAV